MTGVSALLCLSVFVPTCCGATLPAPFDMRVEDCRPYSGGWRVTTTGAVFHLDAAADRVVCEQRIAASRTIAQVSLPPTLLAGLRLASQDESRAGFETDRGLRLAIHCDSVLELTAPHPATAQADGTFTPEYLVSFPGAALALDESGGIGVYSLAPGAPRAPVSREAGRFRIACSLAAHEAFLLCVCPPRAYNWEQHRAERIVHHFPRELSPGLSDRPLPTDEELMEWRKFGNVLVLHLEFWDGFGVQHIKPRDPVRFRQVVDLAHKLGYLVLPYSSTYYYGPARKPDGTWREDAVDRYMAEAAWLLEEYGVDGLYWDGVFDDVTKAWDCARRMRALLGSRRLYVHCTTTPLPWPDVYCPFVDTWADYLLRGEGYGEVRVDPIYLRYMASGYNISNAIGELCYDTCRVDRPMFDRALEAMVRVPFWPGLQVHSGHAYFLYPQERELFRNYYLPAADGIRGRADAERLAGAGRAARVAAREAVAQRQAAFDAYLGERRAALAGQAGNNLAAFRPCTCSYYCSRPEGPHGIGYPTEYATDLNPDTYWAADFPPQWLAVDLGQVQAISAVRVTNYFGDSRHYHYRVEVSTDGEKWREVAAKLDDQLATAEGDLHRFDPCPARYVRVEMLYNSSNYGQHIAELAVYP